MFLCISMCVDTVCKYGQMCTQSVRTHISLNVLKNGFDRSGINKSIKFTILLVCCDV